MSNSRKRLLDIEHANLAAHKPIPLTVDEIPEPDRTTVFFVSTSDMQSDVPPAPSLFHYVTGAFTGIGDDKVPAFIVGMEMLGKLGMLAPADSGSGNMLAHFVLPPGHPDAPEDETAHILTLPVTPEVTDAFVNGGLLTALDNVVYGRTEEGVLFEIAAYVEVG